VRPDLVPAPESLMGAIMAVGIAVSNSILLVSFANDLRVDKEDLTPWTRRSRRGARACAR